MKKTGRRKAEKAAQFTKTQSTSVTPLRTEDKEENVSTPDKARSLSPSPSMALALPSLYQSQKQSAKGGKDICNVYRLVKLKVMILLTKANLMPLFKCTSVEFPSLLHSRNFSKAAGVNTLIKTLAAD